MFIVIIFASVVTSIIEETNQMSQGTFYGMSIFVSFTRDPIAFLGLIIDSMVVDVGTRLVPIVLVSSDLEK